MLTELDRVRDRPIRCLSISAQELPDLGKGIEMFIRPGARDSLIATFVPDVLVLDLSTNTPARVVEIQDMTPRTHIVVLAPPEDAEVATKALTCHEVGVCASDHLDQLEAVIRRTWGRFIA